MSEDSLFTPEESDAIKSSWSLLTAGGYLPVGLLIFERLFTDVPEVRYLFKEVGVSGDHDAPDEDFSAESLKKNEKLVRHAEKVVETLAFLAKHLDDTPVIVEACVELGSVHRMNYVKPEYFDRLGTVLLDVLQNAMKVELHHPTIQAWKKAYGVVSATIKPHL